MSWKRADLAAASGLEKRRVARIMKQKEIPTASEMAVLCDALGAGAYPGDVTLFSPKKGRKAARE